MPFNPFISTSLQSPSCVLDCTRWPGQRLHDAGRVRGGLQGPRPTRGRAERKAIQQVGCGVASTGDACTIMKDLAMERDVPLAGLQRLGMRGGPAITRGVRNDRQTGGAAGAGCARLGPFGRGAAAGAGRRVSAQRGAGRGLPGERLHRPGRGARPGRDHRLRGGDPRRGDGPLPLPAGWRCRSAAPSCSSSTCATAPTR